MDTKHASVASSQTMFRTFTHFYSVLILILFIQIKNIWLKNNKIINIIDHGQ